MNQDDQTTPQASYSAGAMKRMLATPIFLFGGLAAELARSLDCNLLHRSATGQPVRRQQAPS